MNLYAHTSRTQGAGEAFAQVAAHVSERVRHDPSLDDLHVPSAVATGGHRWRRVHRMRLLAVDTAALVLALAAVGLVGLVSLPRLDISVAMVLVVVGVAWLGALSVAGGYRPDSGHRPVLLASGGLASLIAVISVLTGVEVPASWFTWTFAAGAAVLLVGRTAAESALKARRRRGLDRSRVLLVGSARTVRSAVEQLRRNQAVEIVGAFATAAPGPVVAGVEVVDPAISVREAVGAYAVDTVLVTGADAHTAESLRELVWSLEGTNVDVALSLGLSDVSHSRLDLDGTGLPSVRVALPSFSGVKYAVKDILDGIAAGLLILVLSPVLLTTAATVKFTSPGPVFYRQERIGRDGVPFRIWKFRSMRQDADKHLEAVMGDNIRPFYKIQDDPRVTPVGRLLRRYSIDELPQLFNVLTGDMSLVGPRPQIAKEVATYDHVAWRRLRVKPGLTGLWQVSGRSSLASEEGIRLDVAYADNWTLPGDVSILARTAKAVVTSDGAY